MPFKPNYDFQRAERDRAKKALKDSKLRERKAQAELRKANEAVGTEPSDPPDQGAKE